MASFQRMKRGLDNLISNKMKCRQLCDLPFENVDFSASGCLFHYKRSLKSCSLSVFREKGSYLECDSLFKPPGGRMLACITDDYRGGSKVLPKQLGFTRWRVLCQDS